MKVRRLYYQQIIAVLALALLLFNFPIIGVVSDLFLENGWPVSIIYLFAVWFILIVALALISKKGRIDG